MADFKIKQGYNVPIEGEARKEISDLPKPPFVAVCPVEFPGLKPKLAVKQDDTVKVGSPLFFDKKAPELQFLSPASGRVTAINYGPRRVIEEIIIATGDSYEYEEFPKYGSAEISGVDRAALIEQLMKGGVWPYIRRRPYNKIAGPDDTPKAVFVNCMDSAPLANDPNYSLEGKDDAFSAGIAAMKVLCDSVNICASADSANAMFRKPEGVNYHTFSGKHPAGLTGTHISRVDPINKGETVWCVNARDVVMIGSFLLTGRYPIDRVIAVSGPGATKAQYYRGQIGMKVKDIVGGNVESGEMRYVSGNVLNGGTRSEDGWLGFYDDLITVLPEGREQHFIGWMGPGLNKPSFTRAFVSGFLNKRFKMNTNINGGHRAIVVSGMWDKVVALDVFPEFLVKATIAQDIDQMERLGILECDPEDFALCTYLDPSKTEVSNIIAEGLELMEREG